MPTPSKTAADLIRVDFNEACAAQEFPFFANEAYRPVTVFKQLLEHCYGHTGIRYTRVCARPARVQSSVRFPATGPEGQDDQFPATELHQIFEIRAVIGPLTLETADDFLEVQAAAAPKPSPLKPTIVSVLFDSFWHGNRWDWEIAGGRMWIGEDESGDAIIHFFRVQNWITDDTDYHMHILMAPKKTLKDMKIDTRRTAKKRPKKKPPTKAKARKR